MALSQGLPDNFIDFMYMSDKNFFSIVPLGREALVLAVVKIVVFLDSEHICSHQKMAAHINQVL